MPHGQLALQGITSGLLPHIWPLIVTRIAKACKTTRGRYDETDVYRFVESKDWQLWIALDGNDIAAICCTEIINYPRKKYLRICIGTGKNRKQWQDLRYDLESFARANQCDGMESIARKGWLKIFTDYTQSHVFIEKEF